MADDFQFDKELTQTVLNKRYSSTPLTHDEDNYARGLVDYLLKNRSSLNGLVKITYGDTIREGKELRTLGQRMQDEAMRNSVVHAPSSAVSPIVHTDIEPQTNQQIVPETQDLVTDPTYVEKTVIPMLQKGIDALKKEGNLGALTDWAAGKSKSEIHDAIEGKPGIDDPWALANWLHSESGGDEKATTTGDIRKDGDIVPDAVDNQYRAQVGSPTVAMPAETTPFQHLLGTLQQMVGTASYLKQCAADLRDDDPDVAGAYDGIVDKLRDICGDLLTQLVDELQEAQAGGYDASEEDNHGHTV
jgi:hypothetical protein